MEPAQGCLLQCRVLPGGAQTKFQCWLNQGWGLLRAVTRVKPTSGIIACMSCRGCNDQEAPKSLLPDSIRRKGHYSTYFQCCLGNSLDPSGTGARERHTFRV